MWRQGRIGRCGLRREIAGVGDAVAEIHQELAKIDQAQAEATKRDVRRIVLYPFHPRESHYVATHARCKG